MSGAPLGGKPPTGRPPRRWLIPAVMFCVYVIVGAAYTLPVLPLGATHIASDPYDPILNASILWWNATVIPFTAGWWNPPYYHPTLGISAFTENLVGVSVVASPVYWLTGNPLSTYNFAFFASWPLSAFTAYLLALAILRRHDAAALAGLAYGFTPYRHAELGHLQMLSTYWMPLVLFAMHRFLEERRGRWLVLLGAAWILQVLANGYMLFFGAVIVGGWLIYFCSTPATWRAAPALVAALGLANVALLPVLWRYHVVHQQFGLRRVFDEAVAFSAVPGDFISASRIVVAWHWALRETGGNMFPGITALGLVIFGCVYPFVRARAERQPRRRVLRVAIWLLALLSLAVIVATTVYGPWRLELAGVTLRVTDLDRAVNVFILAAIAAYAVSAGARAAVGRRSPFVFYTAAAVACAVLSLGPLLRFGQTVLLDGMPYAWLMALPGFDQVRVPNRFWMLGTLCLAVAAATAFNRWSPTIGGRRRAMSTLFAIAILADAWTTGFPMAVAPIQWTRVERRDRPEPIIELPLGPEWDAAATFRGLRHRRGVVNGVSGYDPPHYMPLQDGLNRREPDVLLALSSLGPIVAIVNSEADRGGSIERYVGAIPGSSLVEDDGKRRAYRLPATPRETIDLGPTIPIVEVRGSSLGAGVAIDGDVTTEWHDNPSQQPGHFILADLGKVTAVGGVTLTLGEWARDYPRRLAIEVSPDGWTWDQVWTGSTAGRSFLAAFEQPTICNVRFSFTARQARFVRLRTLLEHQYLWRVAELNIHAPR